MKITLSKDRDQYVANSTRYTIYGENGKISGYILKDRWGIFYVPEQVSQFDASLASLTANEMVGIAEEMRKLV